MNNRVRVGKRRTIVSRSCECYSKICSLNGLVKGDDGMELGPCHIGKIEEIHTYIDPTVTEAVPLRRELSKIRAAILVLGGDGHVWGAPRRQADMLRGDNFSRERGQGSADVSRSEWVWPQSRREPVRRAKVQLASAPGTGQEARESPRFRMRSNDGTDNRR